MTETKHEQIMRELGKIEEHLKTLNGNVARNVKAIATLKAQQAQDDIDRAKIQGGWKVLAVIGSMALVVGGWIVKYIVSK